MPLLWSTCRRYRLSQEDEADVVQRVWLLFFFQAEDGIRPPLVTGVQTCALPISADLASELFGAVELVKALPGASADPVAVIGLGLGGALALYLASRHPGAPARSRPPCAGPESTPRSSCTRAPSTGSSTPRARTATTEPPPSCPGGEPCASCGNAPAPPVRPAASPPDRAPVCASAPPLVGWTPMTLLHVPVVSRLGHQALGVEPSHRAPGQGHRGPGLVVEPGPVLHAGPVTLDHRRPEPDVIDPP